MNKTPIQWTWDTAPDGTLIPMSGSTWNPLLGCREVSAGCRNCYAARLIGTRFSKNPKLPMYRDIANTAANGHPHFTGNRRMVADRLDEPLRSRKGRKVFVCDMGDLFFEGHPFEDIAAVFGVMAAAQQHTFQVLTKRPERAAEFFAWVGEQATKLGSYVFRPSRPDHAREIHLLMEYLGRAAPIGLKFQENVSKAWPLPNVWIGTSVEDQASADKRIPHLLRVPAVVRFLSMEPLLGPVDLGEWLAREEHGSCSRCGCPWPYVDTREPEHRALRGHVCPPGYGGYLSWIILGGESGPKARPFDLAWARSIMKQADDAGCAVFMKQLGAHPLVEVHGVHTERIRPPRVRDSHGGDPAEWPADLQGRRAFPVARTA